MRWSTGCTYCLLGLGAVSSHMLADDLPDREDTGATALRSAGQPAHVGHSPRPGIHGVRDVARGDDGAVAHDHGDEVSLTLPNLRARPTTWDAAHNWAMVSVACGTAACGTVACGG